MISQLILLLSYPLLTFLYTPDQIGELSLLLAILAIFSILGSGRYELAIPLPKSKSDFIKLVVSSTFILIILSTIIAISIGLLMVFDVITLSNERSKFVWVISLLPLAVLSQGILNILIQVATRISDFKLIAKSRVYQSIMISMLQIAFFKLGSFGLLFAQILTQFIISLRLINVWKIKISIKLFLTKFNIDVMKKYIYLPKYSVPSGLLSTVGQQSPLIIIGSLYGLTYAGLYALAAKLLLTPAAVLSGAIGSVLYSYAPKQYISGTLCRTLEDMSLLLVKTAAPIFIFTYFIIEDFFNLLLDDSWSEAGRISALILPWIFTMLVVSPFQSYFLVLKKEREMMFFQIMFLTLRTLALYVGSRFGDLEIAIMLFSLMSSIIWGAILIRLYHHLDVSLYNVLKAVFPTLIFCALIVGMFNSFILFDLSTSIKISILAAIITVVLPIYFVKTIFPDLKKFKELI